MPKRIRLVMDFDGTMADTFQPSPNEIGVSEAYCLAVEALFGEDGRGAFCAVGGLKNRAPIELIDALQKHGLTTGNLEDAAEKLVFAKMQVLLGEIGSVWPLPCEGYKEFNAKIFQLRQNGTDIHLGILYPLDIRNLSNKHFPYGKSSGKSRFFGRMSLYLMIICVT